MNRQECGKYMPRAKRKCRLLAGHRGCCRNQSVWYCDTCNKPRTGFPAATEPEAGVVSCFMCMLPDNKYYGIIPGRRKQ
jgi:hypothetical protein